MSVADTVSDHTANNARQGVTQESNAVPKGLLKTGVKHAGHKGEAWCNRCFCNTEEETSNHEAGEILASCMAHENYSPGESMRARQ